MCKWGDLTIKNSIIYDNSQGGLLIWSHKLNTVKVFT